MTLKGVTPESMNRDGQVFRCRLLLENPNTEDLKVVGGRVTLDWPVCPPRLPGQWRILSCRAWTLKRWICR